MKRQIKKIIVFGIILSFICSFVVFPDSSEAKTYNISVGKTKQITVKNIGKNVKVTWKISDTKIAKIIKKGSKGAGKYAKIKGLKAGKTTLKAIYKKNKKKITLKYNINVAGGVEQSNDNTAIAVPSPVVIYYPVIVNNTDSNATQQPANNPTEAPSTVTPVQTEEPTEVPPSATPIPTSIPYTATPTPTSTSLSVVEIVDCNFDDGQIAEGIYGNDCTLTVINNMNSNYSFDGQQTGTGTDGKCVKISNRNGYWETSAFAYKMNRLKKGTKYTITFDVYHENKGKTVFGTDFDSNRNVIIHYADWQQIGQPRIVRSGIWERVSCDFELSKDYSANEYIYIEFAYPEEIEENNNSYLVTNKEEYYIDNFSIVGNLYSDTIYKQQYDVTRWYNLDTSGAINGHMHDGYKNNTFAIWMVGAFDNPYSTNEDEYFTRPIDLTNYTGKTLNVSGEFYYEGTNQKTILFQISYTSPSVYPILYKWEAGSNGLDTRYSQELKIRDNTGGSGGKLNANTTAYLDMSFTIPEEAEDEEGYGIYLYFPNKPGGALAYAKDNTFHFKNFVIKLEN